MNVLYVNLTIDLKCAIINIIYIYSLEAMTMAEKSTNILKIKLLKIWEILNHRSEENAPISTVDLITRLNEMGITCDRRTIYADIDCMQAFGYPIHNRRKGHDMLYWVDDRRFNMSEIKILMDAVRYAKFIPKGESEKLIDKVAGLGDSEVGTLLKSNFVHIRTAKHSNEDIYSIIETIERSVKAQKRIAFHYFDLNEKCERVYRHDKSTYTEQPLTLVCDNGNYYLLCYRPQKEYVNHVKIFRLDRMADVVITDNAITKAATAAKSRIANIPIQAFKMYGGVTKNVRVGFDESMISVIYDKFGEDTKINKYRGKYTATVQVQLSPTFWGWLAQFPGQMKILAPDDVKEQYREWLGKAINSL